jgi:DNA polymerase elongation subunit (family B)
LKILLLDIETAPNVVHVWGLWQQNVGINQIMDSGYILCYSAKWYEKDDIVFDSVFQSSPKSMLKGIHKMLDEADAVISYNGIKFDLPTLNKEFLLYGFQPPSPYKQIDLLRTARSQFRFPSNKLDYISQSLGLGNKVHHRGHQLWIDCMNKKPKAWKEMEEYNIQDVVLLEKVYEKLKPWIKNHPNQNLFLDSQRNNCPTCGGTSLQKRGFAITKANKYQRVQCKDCGSWSRLTKASSKRPAVAVTAL